MTVFTASFAGVGVAAAQDLFELVPDATTRLRLLGIELGQINITVAEYLAISIHRGHTVSGSGGSTVTPTNISTYGRTSATAVEANNTTVATTSGVLLWAGAWRLQDGFKWGEPEPVERSAVAFRRHILVAPSERLVIRVSAPAGSTTTSGTVIFEEIGKLGNG